MRIGSVEVQEWASLLLSQLAIVSPEVLSTRLPIARDVHATSLNVAHPLLLHFCGASRGLMAAL